jgi:hypothetical protein
LEKKTAVSGIVLLLLLTSMLSSTFINQQVRASGTSAPTTLQDYDNSWQITDFTINLTVTDYTSGTETYYKINGGETKNVTAHGQPNFTTENANHTLEYWSVDNAGDEEDHNVLTGIKLDKTAPTGSIMINGDDVANATNSDVLMLTLSAEDATSGVVQMRFFEQIWIDWEEYATVRVWRLLSTGDGCHTVYVQFRDNAGLVSVPYASTIWMGGPISSSPPLPTPPPAETIEETPEESPETNVPGETAPPAEEIPGVTAPPAEEDEEAFPLWIVGVIAAVATATPAAALLRLKRK